jgi:hypothetical protein
VRTMVTAATTTAVQVNTASTLSRTACIAYR